VGSFCHPWFTTTNLSYRFPILETSATTLCGITGRKTYQPLSIMSWDQGIFNGWRRRSCVKCSWCSWVKFSKSLGHYLPLWKKLLVQTIIPVIPFLSNTVLVHTRSPVSLGTLSRNGPLSSMCINVYSLSVFMLDCQGVFGDLFVNCVRKCPRRLLLYHGNAEYPNVAPVA